MEYEKKYNEALERAKQFSEKPYLEDSKGIVEYIFPELKESEDGEKIRKVLIKGFQHYDKECKWGEFTTTEILAWLEKQSERKPAWSEDDEDALDIAIRIIQNDGDDCAGILDSDKALKWLKSIKNRIQQPK